MRSHESKLFARGGGGGGEALTGNFQLSRQACHFPVRNPSSRAARWLARDHTVIVSGST